MDAGEGDSNAVPFSRPHLNGGFTKLTTASVPIPNCLSEGVHPTTMRGICSLLLRNLAGRSSTLQSPSIASIRRNPHAFFDTPYTARILDSKPRRFAECTSATSDIGMIPDRI